MEKIRFETNMPVTVALSDVDGKRVDSQYRDFEVLYKTTDGRMFYAVPELFTEIEDLCPNRGEAFTICKRETVLGYKKKSKRIVWEVARVAQEQPRQPESRPTAANNRAPENQHKPESPSQPITGRAEPSVMAKLMAGALKASIDAVIMAREYGAANGLELNFSAEDVRTLASTGLIQHFRNQENQQRYGVSSAPSNARAAAANGGSSWQQ
jgi:hypothetical protein